MNTTEIIKEFRGKNMLTKKMVASTLGLSIKNYNNLENNIINSDYILVFRLLNLLNFTDKDKHIFFNTLNNEINTVY